MTAPVQRHTGAVMDSYLLVDVEATTPSPMTGVMTEMGVVDLATRSYKYLHFYDFTPHPDIPALPVVDPDAEPNLYSFEGTFDGARHDGPSTAHLSYVSALRDLDTWVQRVSGHRRVTFVSDNPGYDFMWTTCAFDAAGLKSPFGHSSRRIGDLAAGLTGRWTQTGSWKKLRDVNHSHDPVDDAQGNAGALLALLRAHSQIVT